MNCLRIIVDDSLKGNKQIQIKMQQERKKIRDNHWAKKRDHWPIRAARRVTPWPPRMMPTFTSTSRTSQDASLTNTDKHMKRNQLVFKWTAQKGVIEAAIGKGGAWHYMGEESEGKTVAWLVGDEPRPEDAETYRRVRGRGHLGEWLARRFVEKTPDGKKGWDGTRHTHTHTHTHTHIPYAEQWDTHAQKQYRDRWETCHTKRLEVNLHKWTRHMHKLTALMYEGVCQEVTWDDQ